MQSTLTRSKNKQIYHCALKVTFRFTHTVQRERSGRRSPVHRPSSDCARTLREHRPRVDRDAVAYSVRRRTGPRLSTLGVPKPAVDPPRGYLTWRLEDDGARARETTQSSRNTPATRFAVVMCCDYYYYVSSRRKKRRNGRNGFSRRRI